MKEKKSKLKLAGIIFLALLLFGACGALFSDGEEEKSDEDVAAENEEFKEAMESTEEEPTEEASTEEEETEEAVAEEETNSTEDLENTIKAFVDGEAAMEEVNEITVEQNDDGYYVLIDYLHYDNPSGYAYVVQIESIIERLTDELEDEDVAELEYIAEANIVRDGEDIQDTVYETILNDLEYVTKDNVEEKAGHLRMSPMLEE